MTSVPHGGRLINRFGFICTEEFTNLKKIELTRGQLNDLDCIASGVYSPLEGFMTKDDYDNVLDYMRLKTGEIWTIPITLPIDETRISELKDEKRVLLVYDSDVYGVLEVDDIYHVDLKREAELIYGTVDPDHPGVKKLYGRPSVNIGGQITMFKRVTASFPNHTYAPEETRLIFQQKGWNTIVGFQTRNPIHRAHEYIQKTALEHVDGLFLHPLVGETKSDDVPAEVRMKCYEVLLDNYYPKDRYLLGVFSSSMRYAGPREAVFHAIVRKNFGCTHFIIGRDHAGVGDYYGTYDAQRLLNQFKGDDLGIVPVCLEHSFYCRKCDQMTSLKTCPHDSENHIHLSGTKVRKMLKEGTVPPLYFSRKEVVDILIDYYQKLKD
ncbi:sulfate adenylyltransferase [Pseudalkalibacillus salsuginis]|uniref:sulfate adenylyltransferase n=1 Tax=Pseudalkalibacillus salsuginis TaxID=2910972 RepID=UPI001F3AB4CF|nr:sulfate adenylyltransferase [Pseudalkalibacillus salsuginis]MCF6409150.1 sulfate adenylyltransferase [Pseudalkalibacillus salsuginis]